MTYQLFAAIAAPAAVALLGLGCWLHRNHPAPELPTPRDIDDAAEINPYR